MCECCQGPPCVDINEDALRGLGSPLRRQLIPRLPARRRNNRVDRLARQLAALTLEDRATDGYEVVMGEPTPIRFHERLNPLPLPRPKLLFAPVQFKLPGPSPQVSAVTEPVKSEKPQLTSGVVSSPMKHIPEINMPKDMALQGSPMSICWPTPQPGPKDIALYGSPMQICAPHPQRLPQHDSAVWGLSSARLPPQPEHTDSALQCSLLSIFSPSPSRLNKSTPPPSIPRLAPMDPTLHRRLRLDEPPISPPGSFLEELREMGEYDGPSALQSLAQAMNISEEQALWVYDHL
ncbi:hypothetical protein MBLNU459_g0110t1 [Dothideomycetes sp. NU459]